jgi:hypothetical protein
VAKISKVSLVECRRRGDGVEGVVHGVEQSAAPVIAASVKEEQGRHVGAIMPAPAMPLTGTPSISALRVASLGSVGGHDGAPHRRRRRLGLRTGAKLLDDLACIERLANHPGSDVDVDLRQSAARAAS